MATREAFLQRVRQAVRDGNCAGQPVALPRRGATGYQGAGPDPIDRFGIELANAGGQLHLAATPTDACAKLHELIAARNCRKVLVSADPLVERLDVAAWLAQQGLECTRVDELTRETSRVPFFGADVGVSGVAHLVAETGTLVMASAPFQPRAVSLLPPVHIALADKSQLLPDLFDLFDLFSPLNGDPKPALPACLTLITGPSKTGDIELRLVTGVHGPGELHVILGTWGVTSDE